MGDYEFMDPDTREYLTSSHDDIQSGSTDLFGQNSSLDYRTRIRGRMLPLIFFTIWFHLLPTVLLVTPFYVYKSFGHESLAFSAIENIVSSWIFVNLFYAVWAVVFIFTLIVLHINESRIRNILYSSVFYLILTFELTTLLVVTVIHIGNRNSGDSVARRVSSFQIGVVMANLIIVFLLLTMISIVRLCIKKKNYDILTYVVVTVFYVVIETIGYLMYGAVGGLDPLTQIDETSRVIVIVCSTLIYSVIAASILAYLWYTIGGRHRLFQQNRSPILIDLHRYDDKISFSSYVVSLYNDLARCLKILCMLCIRPRAALTSANRF
jgi:hypothetical protein